MRKPLIAVALVTTILAGGYTAYWHQQAEDAKQYFISKVAALNNVAKKSPMHTGVFTYESVETSGFPTAIALKVTKPSMTLPMSMVIKALSKPLKLDKVKEGLNWNLEIALGNTMVITSDLMGSKHTASFMGGTSVKSMVDGQIRQQITSDTQTTLTFTTKPSGFLKFAPEYKTPEEAIDAFKALDWSCSGGSSKNEKGETLATSDGSGLTVTHSLDGANRSFTFKLTGASQATAALDGTVNSFLALLSEATGKPMRPLPYSYAEVGKLAFSLDAAYQGPAHAAGLKDPDMSMKFDINNFSITSLLYNSSMNMHMATAPKGELREGSFAVDSKGNVSERYDQIYAIQLEEILNDMLNPEGKTGSELTVAQSLAKIGSPKALIAALLPRFHDFGEMELKIDVKGETPKNFKQLIQSKASLTAFDILTSLYGIKTSGEYVGDQGKLPTGNASFACLHCDAMVTDIGNYAIRVINYINTVSPQSQLPVPSLQLIDGVKKFIRAISLNGADANAQDINITFAMKGMGEFTISGKSILDVMQAYMREVAPFMPQPAPRNDSIAPLPPQNGQLPPVAPMTAPQQ